jgi:hypothetical protein
VTAAEIFAAAGIEMIERDGSAIHAAIRTESGVVTVMANLIRSADRLIVDQVHVDGQGLSLSRIRQVAHVFGVVEDVVEVVVQGGVRTSGAHPGSRPTPIKVKVKL